MVGVKLAEKNLGVRDKGSWEIHDGGRLNLQRWFIGSSLQEASKAWSWDQ